MSTGEPATIVKREKPKSFLTRHLPLEHETALFILVSALDLMMTWVLLYRTAGGPVGEIVESNPLANFFLMRWGLKGLVGFKFGVVLFVCLIAQYIALHDMRKGSFVLKAGTLVVSGVVVYSLSLYLRHQHLLGSVW